MAIILIGELDDAMENRERATGPSGVDCWRDFPEKNWRLILGKAGLGTRAGGEYGTPRKWTGFQPAWSWDKSVRENEQAVEAGRDQMIS